MVVLRSGLISLAILLTLGIASAQQGKDLASPEQKAQQEKAQQSKEGQTGTTEPGAHAPPDPNASAAFVNGRLAVPGAPADSQTVPAKFSERNAALDALPTMAFPLPLTDDQRKQIREAVSTAPVEKATGRSAEPLPSGSDVRELPPQVTDQMPAMRNLGYVRTADKVLLVSPPNRIVVGEIANQ